MSLNLSATTHTIEVTTTGAGSVHVEVSFTDDLAGVRTGGSQTTAIASATTTTVCSAPAASTVRFIDEMTVMAVGANGVTVKKDVSATETTLIGSLTLAAGERAQFVSARGWRVFNADGSEKVTAAPAVTASTTEILTGTDTVKAGTPDSIAALWEQGTDISDGATINVGEGGFFNLITSTTAITSVVFTTNKAGRTVQFRFQTARTLTHNATSLILPGGANITTANGDTCTVTSLGGGNVLVTDYQKATGGPVALVTNAMLANMAANTVKVEATGSAAAPQDLAMGASTILARLAAGNIVAASVAQTLTLLAAFSSVTIQAFTAGGTYTPTSGMKHCIVITTGSGGGGGGADCAAVAQAAGGGGGGAGGTCIEFFSAATIGASQTVTIGTAGSGGSNAGGNGTAGGNSTFGALHTANGGALGTGRAGAAAPNTVGVGAGGIGGVPSGGTLNITGGDGADGWGLVVDGTTDFSAGVGGNGGASFWGGGGKGGSSIVNSVAAGATAVAGNAGKAFGSGGGGAGDGGNTTGQTGGAGVAGCCLVIEFV